MLAVKHYKFGVMGAQIVYEAHVRKILCLEVGPVLRIQYQDPLVGSITKEESAVAD